MNLFTTLTAMSRNGVEAFKMTIAENAYCLDTLDLLKSTQLNGHALRSIHNER